MSSNPARLKKPGNDRVLALLVDPSLFTAPYDAAVTDALQGAGAEVRWVTRAARPGEEYPWTEAQVALHFYRAVDKVPLRYVRLRGVIKGLSHVVGLIRLLGYVIVRKPDVVHVQWAVLPLFDSVTIRLIRCFAPVVMTAHDTIPYNGQKISFLQNAGFDLPLRAVDKIVVHTKGACQNLIDRGLAPGKIVIIPHGPFSVNAVGVSPKHRDPRWTFVIFGYLKPYKGIDVVIEALGLITPEDRARMRVIVAGTPIMDVTPLQARAAELGIEDNLIFRLGRLDEQEMADLFEETDCFLFAYRQIDASGAYFLAAPLQKWIIASRVGVFAEDMRPGIDGRLVEPGSVTDLREALLEAAISRPLKTPERPNRSWASIGTDTISLYRSLMAQRKIV